MIKKLIILCLFLFSFNAFSTISIPEFQQLYQTPGISQLQVQKLDKIWQKYAWRLEVSSKKIVSYTRQYQQMMGLAKQDPKFASAAQSIKKMLEFENGQKQIMYDQMIKEGYKVFD